ncbi:Uncharacterised protein [Vibrio cholerae]|nr:Uncharacterised protein [Vibrio cholerae]
MPQVAALTHSVTAMLALLLLLRQARPCVMWRRSKRKWCALVLTPSSLVIKSPCSPSSLKRCQCKRISALVLTSWPQAWMSCWGKRVTLNSCKRTLRTWVCSCKPSGQMRVQQVRCLPSSVRKGSEMPKT